MYHMNIRIQLHILNADTHSSKEWITTNDLRNKHKQRRLHFNHRIDNYVPEINRLFKILFAGRLFTNTNTTCDAIFVTYIIF